jgi:hypothetical protein
MKQEGGFTVRVSVRNTFHCACVSSKYVLFITHDMEQAAFRQC